VPALRTRTTEGERRSPGVRAVERSLAILTAFTGEGPELTLDEISLRTNLPKSTAHRLIQTLMAAGFLERGRQGGSYRLSVTAAQLGTIALRDRTREAICEVIIRLRNETGETVGLSVLEGAQMVVVERLVSRHQLRYNLQLGSRLPAHATSSGKVLLADRPEHELRRLFASPRLAAFTPRTIASLDALVAHLAEVGAAGYAIDDEEYLAGLRCISVPVRDLHGNVTHALGIAGVAARLTVDELLALRPQLEEASQVVGQVLLGLQDPEQT
jgi:DNA-binding IclR family transcriptional regulator